MRRIHRAGLVHIAKREGYQQTAYYLAGPGEDAPKVTLRESIPQLIAETAMSADEIAQIVGAKTEIERMDFDRGKKIFRIRVEVGDVKR